MKNLLEMYWLCINKQMLWNSEVSYSVTYVMMTPSLAVLASILLASNSSSICSSVSIVANGQLISVSTTNLIFCYIVLMEIFIDDVLRRWCWPFVRYNLRVYFDRWWYCCYSIVHFAAYGSASWPYSSPYLSPYSPIPLLIVFWSRYSVFCILLCGRPAVFVLRCGIRCVNDVTVPFTFVGNSLYTFYVIHSDSFLYICH